MSKTANARAPAPHRFSQLSTALHRSHEFNRIAAARKLMRMSKRDRFIKTAGHYLFQLAARIVSRDKAHLSPTRFSRAAARRFAAGLRAMEAYLRRFLLALALQIEHDLPRAQIETPLPAPRDKRTAPRGFHLRIFTGQRDFPHDIFDGKSDAPAWDIPRPIQQNTVPTARFFDRFNRLKHIAENPLARARRLAWHLARRRSGPLLAPDIGRHYVPRRYGTEISAIYDSFSVDIADGSRARPPPLGPVPRPPPRVRVL